MLTKIRIGNRVKLALAPLAVLPECQRQGVGMALIQEGHRIARKLEFRYSVMQGSERYYPRAGNIPAAARFGIRAPLDIPEQNYIAIHLLGEDAALDGVVGYANELGYSREFFACTRRGPFAAWGASDADNSTAPATHSPFFRLFLRHAPAHREQWKRSVRAPVIIKNMETNEPAMTKKMLGDVVSLRNAAEFWVAGCWAGVVAVQILMACMVITSPDKIGYDGRFPRGRRDSCLLPRNAGMADIPYRA